MNVLENVLRRRAAADILTNLDLKTASVWVNQTCNKEDDNSIKVIFESDKTVYETTVNSIKNWKIKQGDIRQVKWKDGYFYAAKIVTIGDDGSIEVIFVADKLKYKTSINCIKNRKIARGDIRQVKWKDGRFYAAKILTIGRTRIPLVTKKIEDKEYSTPPLPEFHQDDNKDSEEAKKIEDKEYSTPPLPEFHQDDNKDSEEEMRDFSPDESEYDPKGDSSNSYSEEELSEAENTSKSKKPSKEKKPVIKESVSHRRQTEEEQQLKINDDFQTENNNFINTAFSRQETNFLEPPTLKVDTTKKKINGKRTWDRRYNCKFCNKSFPKLPRHLESKHAEEIEVASFLALPKGSSDIKFKIDKIRNEGERLRNFKAYCTSGAGLLIPKRRPTTEVDSKKFLPCEHCGVLFTVTYLARHSRDCVNRPSTSNADSSKSKTNSMRLRSRCAMLLPTAPNVPAHFKKVILGNMAYDEIYNVIISDQLILAFGVKLFETKMRRPSQYREVKDRMRELARLLIKIKSRNKQVKSLTDLIDATKYNSIVESAREVAGFKLETGLYATPSLAIKIGQSLMKCATRYKGICMDDEILHEMIPKVELFQRRMEENWTADVTKDAHNTLSERKWNTPKRMPITEDVRKLHKYIMGEQGSLVEKLEKYKDTHTYRRLAENTLCRVILLNRRRVGESQFIKLSDYLKCKLNTELEESEIMMGLTETEKLLVKSLLRIEIRGKKGRMVPVILTKDLQDTIQLLIDYRKLVGVPDTNDFLFPALHSMTGHFRADILLRHAALKSGAKHPECLTGTQLRKHVATMIQLLNLRENELDAVANYLGHDIRIHRQYYRLPHDAMQLAKVSKLLINMEHGNVGNMRGKNLDEITVDDSIEDGEEDIPDDDDDDDTADNESQIPSNNSKRPANAQGRRAANVQDRCEPFVQEQCQTQPRIATKRKEGKLLSTMGPAKKRLRFSEEETETMKTYFKKFISEGITPSMKHVTSFFGAHPSMSHVPWSRVKMFVYNCFTSKKPRAKK